MSARSSFTGAKDLALYLSFFDADVVESDSMMHHVLSSSSTTTAAAAAAAEATSPVANVNSSVEAAVERAIVESIIFPQTTTTTTTTAAAAAADDDDAIAIGHVFHSTRSYFDYNPSSTSPTMASIAADSMTASRMADMISSASGSAFATTATVTAADGASSSLSEPLRFRGGELGSHTTPYQHVNSLASSNSHNGHNNNHSNSRSRGGLSPASRRLVMDDNVVGDYVRLSEDQFSRLDNRFVKFNEVGVLAAAGQL